MHSMGDPGHMALMCKEGQLMKNVQAQKIQDGGTPGTSAQKDHASTLWSSEASWYLVRVEGDELKGMSVLALQHSLGFLVHPRDIVTPSAMVLASTGGSPGAEFLAEQLCMGGSFEISTCVCLLASTLGTLKGRDRKHTWRHNTDSTGLWTRTGVEGHSYHRTHHSTPGYLSKRNPFEFSNNLDVNVLVAFFLSPRCGTSEVIQLYPFSELRHHFESFRK